MTAENDSMAPAGHHLRAARDAFIDGALDIFEGNRTRAARALGIERTQTSCGCSENGRAPRRP